MSSEELEKSCLKWGMKINAENCQIISGDDNNNINVNETDQLIHIFSIVIPGSSFDVWRKIHLASLVFSNCQQSAEYTNCILCKEIWPPTPKRGGGPKYNTKWYPVVRLQFWSSRKCGVPQHCYYCQVHSDLDVVVFVRIPSMGQIDLFENY